MKITALEEYGLRCLLRVAEQEDGEAIPAQVIAEKEGLSLPYTQKILRILSLGGLVDSRRGAQGGFYLASSAEEISLGDAMRVLGGMLTIEDICERHTGELRVCNNQCDCSIRPVWLHISNFLIATLDGISLSLLVNDERTVARHLKGVREAYSIAHL
ncbi:MAG: RrF2 family transcriptional regulator [Bradymonadaceae bacterium]